MVLAPSLKLKAATVCPPLMLPLPRTLPGTSIVSFFAECLEIWLRLGSAQFFLLVSNLEAVSLHIGEPVVLL